MTDAQRQIIALLEEIKAATGGGGGAAWGGITGTLGDQTDLANALALKQTEAQVNALIAAAAPYKVYTALLTQTGTDAPVATVKQNTLGVTVIWAYSSAGNYTGSISPAVLFQASKTACVISGVGLDSAADARTARLTRIDDATVLLVTLRNGVGNVDDVLVETLIEIRVYP